MKRTILSFTTATAIALALPAVAQTSDVDRTVMEVLASNGYPESSFDMLTEGEVANIYVTATSEDAGDVAGVLAGLDLPSDDASNVLRRSGEPSDIELRVREELESNGYEPDMIVALSAGDIASIYSAATTGGATDVERALSSAIDASQMTARDNPSDAEQRATMYLASQGYSDAEIDEVSEGELLSIYVALTSGDATEVNRVVASAMES